MEVSEGQQKGPFQDSVLEIIAQSGTKELEVVGVFLMTTVVPARRNEVVAAWSKRCKEINFPAEFAQSVADSIGH